MASADDYAAWIVQNQEKKGTPEFDTVAKAYQEAKGDAPVTQTIEAPPPKPEGLKDQFLRQTYKGFTLGGPLGAMAGAIPASSRALDEAAYSAGGKVTDIASGLGLPAPVAAGAGLAANVGMQAIPAVVGGGGAAKVAAPALEIGATHLMQSAVKPILKDLKSGRAARAIETMLDEGINVTKGGMSKLRDKITELNFEVAETIRNSPATIDKYAAWPAVKQALDKFSRQVNSNADTAKIQSVWHEFLEHPLISGRDIPIQLAQELKQGTGRILSKKYGEMGSAEVEAQKAITRGLKDEIAIAAPEVVKLNAQESKLLNALGVSERRVLMEANKNPMGLALIAHNPATWAAFLADRSAAFKSLAARMLHSGRERIPQAVAGTGIAVTDQQGQR